MKTNPNDSAFSATAYTDPMDGKGSARGHGLIPGLTKREYFAAMAMQGFTTQADTKPSDAIWIAEASIKIADALITELNKIDN